MEYHRENSNGRQKFCDHIANKCLDGPTSLPVLSRLSQNAAVIVLLSNPLSDLFGHLSASLLLETRLLVNLCGSNPSNMSIMSAKNGGYIVATIFLKLSDPVMVEVVLLYLWFSADIWICALVRLIVRPFIGEPLDNFGVSNSLSRMMSGETGLKWSCVSCPWRKLKQPKRRENYSRKYTYALCNHLVEFIRTVWNTTEFRCHFRPMTSDVMPILSISPW